MNSSFKTSIFTVAKFQPSNVVLLHNFTRKLYCYAQSQRDSHVQVEHEIIMNVQPLCSGFIYEKQLTNLARQVKPKISSQKKDYFNQAELYNTFEPILNFLKTGKQHGALNLENILIDTEGNIRLKDPKITKQSKLFTNDFQRLGFFMLQCAVLKEQQELTKLQMSKFNLVQMLPKFSAKFITNIWLLLNNTQPLLKRIQFSDNMPQNGEYYSQIQSIEKYIRSLNQRNCKNQQIKKNQEKKIIVIPPLNLKFNKAKKADNKKMNLSAKRQLHNQNQNQQQNSKNFSGEGIEKNISGKMSGKPNQIKLKIKKLQLIDNCRSPLKRKGKTVEKKIK